MTVLHRWYMLLCVVCVTSCHESPVPDAAEQARISGAMMKVEAGQARSDAAAVAASAKANVDAETARRTAAGSNNAD